MGAEPLEDRNLLGFPGLNRLLDPSQAVEAIRDSTKAKGELAPVSQGLEQRDLLPQDLQGILVLASKVKNLGDLAENNRKGERGENRRKNQPEGPEHGLLETAGQIAVHEPKGDLPRLPYLAEVEVKPSRIGREDTHRLVHGRSFPQKIL